MYSVVGYLGSLPGGLPHSEIHGSKPVSGSPWLIAAVHVLHRLSSPRHPPRALCILINLPKAHQRPPHPLRCCGPTWRRQARSTYRSTCRSPSLPSGSSRRASDGAPYWGWPPSKAFDNLSKSEFDVHCWCCQRSVSARGRGSSIAGNQVAE